MCVQINADVVHHLLDGLCVVALQKPDRFCPGQFCQVLRRLLVMPLSNQSTAISNKTPQAIAKGREIRDNWTVHSICPYAHVDHLLLQRQPEALCRSAAACGSDRLCLLPAIRLIIRVLWNGTSDFCCGPMLDGPMPLEKAHLPEVVQ